MLRAHLDTHSHSHSHVFLTKDNELLRRSNFSRRATRPAADGTLHKPCARHHLQAIVPGLVFHSFRHSHKTWLIADGIPQVAQARRLGHVIPDKIEHIYSHVAPEIETRPSPRTPTALGYSAHRIARPAEHPQRYDHNRGHRATNTPCHDSSMNNLTSLRTRP
ncbi:hypothetical protein [Saccharopolyspora sp. ASAGF58]|uniref:hypothetical protein n=1 Tax=Saccharopolyspora sp. ASAGF58 TaxID=2719023 RepID=UPI00143FFC88|nr:hypothetical protein [Saccharopolyspora sp. ASAGF58]QIZ37757.1 hypothetical protein FDZ84_28190 [Saccharopolyspora sp. ASAGF58]